jgi:hypothetical protein
MKWCQRHEAVELSEDVVVDEDRLTEGDSAVNDPVSCGDYAPFPAMALAVGWGESVALGLS